jgi:hypothetical protein
MNMNLFTNRLTIIIIIIIICVDFLLHNFKLLIFILYDNENKKKT